MAILHIGTFIDLFMHERLGILQLPQDGIPVTCRFPQNFVRLLRQFATTNSYSQVKTGIVRVRTLHAQIMLTVIIFMCSR